MTREAAEAAQKDRARIRALAMRTAVLPDADKPITDGELEIHLTAAPTALLDKDGNVVGIECFVTVLEDGVEVVGLDPHHRFINPPGNVPDGTYEGASFVGHDYQKPHYVEDYGASFQLILAESVRAALKLQRNPPKKRRI